MITFIGLDGTHIHSHNFMSTNRGNFKESHKSILIKSNHSHIQIQSTMDGIDN